MTQMHREPQSVHWEQLWQVAPQVPLDELPRYTPWIERILGRTKFHCPQRIQREIIREYETETYGPQLQLLKESPGASYTDLFRASHPQIHDLCCAKEGEFRLLSPQAAFEVQVGIFLEVLASYAPAPALVELGSGNGRLITSFSELLHDTINTFIGLEPMPSGRAILEQRAKALANLVSAEGDIRANPFTSLPIPKGAIFYTSWVISLFPDFNAKQFVDTLCSLQPRAIIFFEPIPEILDPGSLYDTLVDSYTTINNYNKNFYSSIQNDSRLSILRTRKNVFGNNPLYPCSIIECTLA